MSEESDIITLPVGKVAHRVLDNWIDAFMEYTAGLPSPKLYRKWVAYTTVSGAMERRVWMKSRGGFLYPNLAILLIGRPGVGKSFAINVARKLWAKTGLLNVAPSGMTKAAFIDHLCEKVRNFEYEGNLYMGNSMCIASSEFGVLMPDYDRTFVNTFNDVYDCGDVYDDRTRGGGLKIAQRPHVCMIAGTQPKYLSDILPSAAWEQGFMARLMMVYQAKEITINIFDPPSETPEMERELVIDLISIANLVGRIDFDPEAKKMIEYMNAHKKENAPDHPKLIDYVTRRVFQCIKVSMVIAIADSNVLLVRKHHVEEAMESLLEIEVLMPEVFKEMSFTEDAVALKEAHIFMFTYCKKYEKTFLLESDLISFLSKRVPVIKINYFIDTMLGNGMMKNVGINSPGMRKFSPMAVDYYA